MYKKILVPLDGSPLAEAVLPHVETIVNSCQSPEVMFIRIVEPTSMPVSDVSTGGYVFPEANTLKTLERIDQNNIKEAEDYLSKIIGQTRYDNAKVDKVVLYGRAADSIVDYAKKYEADLIVIATHGRSGISRWVMGSNADRILRASCVPVFMIRAPGCVPGI